MSFRTPPLTSHRNLVDFAHAYARRTQEDHRLFVDAFRAGAVPGISSST